MCGPQNKRRRRQEAGTGIDSSTAIDLGKKAAGSSVGQMIIKDVIKVLKLLTKKLKAN